MIRCTMKPRQYQLQFHSSTDSLDSGLAWKLLRITDGISPQVRENLAARPMWGPNAISPQAHREGSKSFQTPTVLEETVLRFEVHALTNQVTSCSSSQSLDRLS